tara:strand:+ start:17178 stop:17417 length:240 start_codon:yes stop_codon:yes gene_type:complete
MVRELTLMEKERRVDYIARLVMRKQELLRRKNPDEPLLRLVKIEGDGIRLTRDFAITYNGEEIDEALLKYNNQLAQLLN